MKKTLIAALAAAIMVAAAIVIPTRITAKAPANPPAPSAALPAQGGRNEGRHPHMTAAIQYLEQAKAQLKQAHPAFAGHRLRALQSTNAALKECHEGLEAKRKK
ncbi:MAG TPA: hypothetical protein VG028_12540 [Terriglobia bacterium]|nr:hypothetical protein [Terriglobia bacterium]